MNNTHFVCTVSYNHRYSQPKKLHVKKYIKDGKECVLCLVRKKLIQATPEEIVRQEFISSLVIKYKVPEKFINAEIPLSYFVKGKKGRVDILVTAIGEKDEMNYPLMVIECKAPNVPITDKVFEQAVHYDNILQTKLMVLTNGTDTLVFGWNEKDNEYQEVKEIPNYSNLIKNCEIKFKEKIVNKWKRPNHKSDTIENRNELSNWGNIGEDTDLKLVSFLTNLVGLLYEEEEKVSDLPLKNKRFVSDGGLRFTTFGNSAGGSFAGDYRYFLVENKNDETELVSISVMGKISAKNHPKWGNSKGYTLLNIAIDNFENSHLSLEYSIDRFVEIENEKYSFWHDGTLTVGNKGRAKNKDVIDFIRLKTPELVLKNKIYLGTIDNSKSFEWKDKEVKKLIANFIEYGFVRDEFRKMRKEGGAITKCINNKGFGT